MVRKPSAGNRDDAGEGTQMTSAPRGSLADGEAGVTTPGCEVKSVRKVSSR